MDDLDQALIDGIKRTMKEGKFSMRSLADRTGIPYRSLQNYLSGTTRMPASAYVQICNVMGVDNQYILQGNFHLQFMQLWDALWIAFGDGLADLSYKPSTTGFHDQKRHNQKQAAASAFAEKISDAYDRVLRERLEQGFGHTLPTIVELRARREKRRSSAKPDSEGPQ